MSPLKASIFLAVGLCLFTNYIIAEDAKNNEDDENVIKIFKRLIPADVLRGLCILLISRYFLFRLDISHFLLGE